MNGIVLSVQLPLERKRCFFASSSFSAIFSSSSDSFQSTSQFINCQFKITKWSYLIPILVMSIVGFLVMTYDKYQAINEGWRVRNVQNYILAIALGAPGVFAAMIIWWHKIHHCGYFIVVAIGLGLDYYLARDEVKLLWPQNSIPNNSTSVP